jgi:hypothetical protein
MSEITDNRDAIRRLLEAARRIAVVGCSPKPDRDSHVVARYLIDAGYDVVPVNPGHDELLGRRCYPDLVSIPGGAEIVDIFRRSEHVPPIVEEAVKIGAKAVWMQQEVEHAGAARRASEAGLDVVQNRCIKVWHALLKSRSR